MKGSATHILNCEGGLSHLLLNTRFQTAEHCLDILNQYIKFQNTVLHNVHDTDKGQYWVFSLNFFLLEEGRLSVVIEVLADKVPGGWQVTSITAL